MTRVICDHCRTEVEPDSYGFAPHGWLHVDRRGVYTHRGSDYCSLACAQTALEIEARAAALDAETAGLAAAVVSESVS